MDFLNPIIYHNKNLELLLYFDKLNEKMWIDKNNLCILMKTNKITLSRKISKIIQNGSILIKENITTIKTSSIKPLYCYDFKVVKLLISNNDLLNDLLEFEIEYIKRYRKIDLGKIYMKDGNLVFNHDYPDNDFNKYSSTDLEKLFDINLDNKDYSLEELLIIGLNSSNYEFKYYLLNILKKCLLDGYYINNELCKNNREKIINITRIADNLLDNNLTDEEKTNYYKTIITFNNQVYDSETFLIDLIKKGRKKIIIKSKYINDSIFDLLNNITIKIYIYTSTSSPITSFNTNRFMSNHRLELIRNYEESKTLIIVDNNTYLFDVNMINILKENANCTLIEI